MQEEANAFWSSLAPEPVQSAAQSPGQFEVLAPSEAWRDSVFLSDERLSAARSTTRFPIDVRWSGRTTMVSGYHERTGCLLVDHLWAIGFISRWKPQPFCLSEIGGSVAVVDILIELRKPLKPLHLIQIKAARFVTKEVEEAFERQRRFAQSKRFGFHVWTNADVLGGQTPHTLSSLDRGRRNQCPNEVITQIGSAAKERKTLGELLPEFGWDSVAAAAANLAFFFDVTKRMDENTPITTAQAPDFYEYLFTGKSSPISWWDSMTRVGMPSS